ncbi:MAG: 4a-hydroxytetrahydrobiopterin dehydratase [Patescibacteria group bacterium]
MDKPKVLTNEEIEAGLKNLPGWEFARDPSTALGIGKICKEYKFKDFMDSLEFVNFVALVFEANDHHPDTHIMYNKILFELQRFDIGGKVTDRDLFIAGEIEKNYLAWSHR